MMSHSRRAGLTASAVVSAMIAVGGVATDAQNQPDQYRLVPNWAKLPDGATWAGTVDANVDAKGNLWLFHRGAPAMVLAFDRSGTLIKSFANDVFATTHGGHVDQDGNIWVTESAGKDGRGYQVFKFSPEGKPLMTLGTKGVARASEEAFTAPDDVVTNVKGEIFVMDGHSGPSARIVKFSKDGKFIKAIGKKGKGPGEFDGPHNIVIDAEGRLLVADRGNGRVEILDQEGGFIEQWISGKPAGLAIDRAGLVYIADQDEGIKIANMKDGKVSTLIPISAFPAAPAAGAAPYEKRGPEGVAVDAEGNVYGLIPGQTRGRVEKFEKVKK
jgi:sugar lactone lactonase YvrE